MKILFSGCNKGGQFGVDFAIHKNIVPTLIDRRKVTREIWLNDDNCGK